MHCLHESGIISVGSLALLLYTYVFGLRMVYSAAKILLEVVITPQVYYALAFSGVRVFTGDIASVGTGRIAVR